MESGLLSLLVSVLSIYKNKRIYPGNALDRSCKPMCFTIVSASINGVGRRAGKLVEFS